MIWGGFVFTDIDAEDSCVDVIAKVFDALGDTWVIESHSIDDGLVIDEAKEARTWVAALGDGGEGANFDMTEAVGGKGIDTICFLIETGGEADAVWEAEPHGVDGFLVSRGRVWIEDAKVGAESEAAHSGVVGTFRTGEAEQQ